MAEKDIPPTADENEGRNDKPIGQEQTIAAEDDSLLLTDWEAEAKESEERAKTNYEMYLKVLAEMENLKKRTQKDHEELAQYSNVALIKKLLPILDDFDRAMLGAEQNYSFDNLYQGLAMIHKKFHDMLAAEGVELIEAVGREFNPQYHQPLTVEASDQGENLVIEQFQKGYTYKNRLLRPSLVKVSQ